ncbi:unnamed protein product [Urochloa decumbens]|uniref:Uncharacterized protein n=1 Tax=Urochloa decumbens TaxID=240449 RepID=A0ABC9ANJ8_9POAL
MDRGIAERDPESMVRRGTAARAGEDGGGASDRKTCAADPSEKIINYYVLILTVVLIIVRGLGVLAFAWSTVVLLGGFVQLIYRIDFWFITVISFAQIARIFDASADEQYLYLVDLLSRAVSTALSRIRNKQSATTSGADGFACSATKSPIKIFFTVLLVLIFPLFNIVVSSLRLRNKDFGNERNERPGVMIFYSLALSQGVFYLLWFILEKLKSLAVNRVADGYKFDDKNLSLGRKYVEKYLNDTRSKCLKDLSATEGRNLIAYASGLLDSDHKDKYLAGAEILNHLISKNRLPNEELIRSSRKRIQKLVLMLSWKDEHYQDVRLLAAEIVLHVAENISISQFPGTLESVSALIQPSKENGALFHRQSSEIMEQGDPQPQQLNEEDAERESKLIVQGLRILDKLAQDRNNGLEMLRADALLVDIMAWICSKPFIREGEQDKWLEIVRLSFSVLVRLAELGAQTAERLRSKIHHELLPSWVPYYARYPDPDITLMAIETYSHAFTTDKIGDESDQNQTIDQKRKKFVEVVLRLFLNDQGKWRTSPTPPAPEVRKKAGEALADLCVYRRNCICLVTLDEHKDDVVRRLEEAMHLGVNKEYRAIAADILKRFYVFLCRPRRETQTERSSRLRSVVNQALKLLIQFYPETETTGSNGIVHGGNNVTGFSQIIEISSSQSDENHQARLEAALVRMIYDVHSKVEEDNFERKIEEDHPGFQFVVLLERLIVKNSRTSLYHLDIVKWTAKLICEIIKNENSRMEKISPSLSRRDAASSSDGVWVKKIVDKVVDSLSKASQVMSGEDSWTLFIHNRQRGAHWATSLAVLEEEVLYELEKYKGLLKSGHN